jgi:uncharacterized protein (DUF362 family)
MDEAKVSIAEDNSFSYPSVPPFHPSEVYPELILFKEIKIDSSNKIYKNVRESFKILGYDVDNYNTSKWNPLGWLIKPGESVFIKPNMIAEKHKLNNDWEYVITHGSVIRAVLDYIFIAMQGKGRVIIGDAPQTDSKFSEIIKLMGLKEIREVYNSFNKFEIEIINLQDEYWIEKDDVYIETVKLPGDPRGGTSFNLGKESYFSEFDGKGKKYYGAFYDIKETNDHHNDQRHEYAVSKSPIIADVFINIPKLKTHKKCGVTINLKSLVGINANKNWLPHYMFGSPETGGDQFPELSIKGNLENKIVVRAKQVLLKKNSLAQFIARKLKKFGYRVFGGTEEVIRSGNWYGNDTVWRMSLDLNKILMFGNPDGTFRNSNAPKKFFSVIDGVISMEGNGPVAGTPKQIGAIITGSNPVAVDAVCVKIMGFDWQKLPLVTQAFRKDKFPLINVAYNDIVVKSNNETFNKFLIDISKKDTFHFKPHFGWLGHIEEI